MTEDRMPLAELLQKSGDGDFLRSRRRGGAADADGGRCGGPDRRRPARAQRRAAELPQRLPRPHAGHAAGLAAAAHPEAAPGLLLPALPGAAQDRREGAGGGDPGGLDRRRLDPAGRRAGAGHGAVRHLEEPRSPSCARTSTSGSTPSWTGRSRATGRICGSTPPTSRCARAAASSRSRR